MTCWTGVEGRRLQAVLADMSVQLVSVPKGGALQARKEGLGVAPKWSLSTVWEAVGPV